MANQSQCSAVEEWRLSQYVTITLTCSLQTNHRGQPPQGSSGDGGQPTKHRTDVDGKIILWEHRGP